MILDFISRNMEIWTYSEEKEEHRILIKNNKYLAKKLNRALPNYPKNYKFINTEDYIFKFTSSQIEYIESLSPALSKTLKQIVPGKATA